MQVALDCIFQNPKYLFGQLWIIQNGQKMLKMRQSGWLSAHHLKNSNFSGHEVFAVTQKKVGSFDLTTIKVPINNLGFRKNLRIC